MQWSLFTNNKCDIATWIRRILNVSAFAHQGLFLPKTESDFWMLPLMTFFFKNLLYQNNCKETMNTGEVKLGVPFLTSL